MQTVRSDITDILVSDYSENQNLQNSCEILNSFGWVFGTSSEISITILKEQLKHKLAGLLFNKDNV